MAYSAPRLPPSQHADEAERFAKALASDTILPEDF
jgi:hypothetical protein